MIRVLIFSAMLAAHLNAVEPAPNPRLIATSPLPDTQEIVLLANERPIRVRVQARIEGKPLTQVWDTAFRGLFDICDRNRDGFLSDKEVQHLLPAEPLKGLLTTGFLNGQFGTLPTIAVLDRDADGRISFAELDSYYRMAVRSPLAPSLALPENTGNARVTESLFKLLDANGDGELTREEVNGAERLFATRDTNEDECLSVNELMPYGVSTAPALYAGRLGLEQASEPRQNGPLFLYSTALPGIITQRLLQTYDLDRDFELTQEESGFDRDKFMRLDRDGDGKLNGEELDGWRTGTADVDVFLSLSANAAHHTAGLITPASLIDARGLSATLAGHRLTIRCGRQAIEFQVGIPAVAGVRRFTIKANYSQQFTIAAKGKTFVELSDLDAAQFQFLKPLAKLADLDEDGRLTLPEFEKYTDLLQGLADLGIGTTHSLQVPSLFQFLDANRDGRLTVRETRTGWDRLRTLTTTRDSINKAAIRPVVNIQFTWAAQRPYIQQASFVNANPVVAPPGASGPVWFRKMDRNSDSDVSRTEFLGTPAAFNAIDADGDGLISLKEADAFDAKRPKD